MDEDRNPNKRDAASKRQTNRDIRRSRDNPNRTAQEDADEGRRKRTQHYRSGRGRPDADKDGGSRREGGRSVSRRPFERNDPRGDRARDTRSNRSRNRRGYGNGYDDRRRNNNSNRRNRDDYYDDEEFDEAEAPAVVVA